MFQLAWTRRPNALIKGGFGRGGGDRNDRQTNKACALYALQQSPLANWNKRNKRQAQPSQVCRAADAESQQQLSVWLGPEPSTTRRLNRLAGVARFRSTGLLVRNSGQPVVLPEFATGRGDHSPQADFPILICTMPIWIMSGSPTMRSYHPAARRSALSPAGREQQPARENDVAMTLAPAATKNPRQSSLSPIRSDFPHES